MPRPGGDDDGYPGARGAAGRATVGRAVVRPVSPAGPGEAGPELGAPIRGAKSPSAAKRAKKRRRANWLIGSLAVLVILAGSSVMAFTYYYDKVPAADYTELETTTITYANGRQLAKIGEQNRTIVPADKISPVVTNAVMAAEDKNFMDHGGIDLKGIARAAWNNISGGSTQGASTITQQYARHAADLNEISVGRKVREAMLSRKIEADMTKQEILGKYLNAIYFGRGAHGVEAAAQAYFKKSVLTPPGKDRALTVEEAAVLASVIKQPEFDPSTGHKGYDPQVNPEGAKERWAYTLGNMQEKGWITPDQRTNAKYPKVERYDPKKDCATGCVGKTPQGNIVNRVKEELTAMGIPWEKGGYKITTTIDPRAQDAAQNAAQNRQVGSPMNKLPKNYRAALVAVEPETGRVLAYYGGDDGTGTDFAGLNEVDGKIFGGHPPGSSFKTITLAAGLKEGYSFESRWDATKKTEDGKEINNAGRKIPCGKSCDLERSTVQSYNFAFYWLADQVGVDKVLAAAKSAGITSMWNDKGDYLDLTKENLANGKSKLGIDNQVGFGQYAVTVLDQANGMATLANRGKYIKAHFVKTVEEKDLTGVWRKRGGEQLKPREAFPAAEMDNLNGVLQKVPAVGNDQLRGGRPAAGKTGTWEFDKKDNAHAWMIGATPQIASAVWVGGEKGGAIKERDGSPMG
ncbi:MAG TPA: transglycosylase domain-containing protein, partial [Catenuloplanes sp.]